MSTKQTDQDEAPRRKETRCEDLPARTLSEGDAAAVKGGAISAINTGLIIPCVRTIGGIGGVTGP